MADTTTLTTELGPPEERGTTTIADRVVERVAAQAAGEIGRVRDTHSTLTDLVRRGLPRADAVVAGRATRITVHVAAPWATPLPELTARVRDHVADKVQTLLGMSVSAVDVRVDDVVYDAAPTRRVL